MSTFTVEEWHTGLRIMRLVLQNQMKNHIVFLYWILWKGCRAYSTRASLCVYMKVLGPCFKMDRIAKVKALCKYWTQNNDLESGAIMSDIQWEAELRVYQQQTVICRQENIIWCMFKTHLFILSYLFIWRYCLAYFFII